MSESAGPKTVTILTPVLNEEANLPVYEKVVRELFFSRSDVAISVLFVDDGSTDRSWAVISEMCAREPRFRGLRLSRNFGAHTALSCGFHHARADALATLACDLQDPPETVLEFIDAWKKGTKIVWGKRRTRDDGAFRGIASKVFALLLRRFAMPKGSKFQTGSFLLVDKKVADCFRQFEERNRITFALVAWTGFDQVVVEYDRRPRTAGRTGWTTSQLAKALYDAFIGFSLLPIRLITILGVAIFLGSIPLSLYVLFDWITGNPLKGWTSTVLAISILSGLQFLIMGVLGEYLYRIYSEVVKRPLYFVAQDTSETLTAEKPSGDARG